jgi:hypothetical protein
VNQVKIINNREYILKNKRWVRNIEDSTIIELYKKVGSINKVSIILGIDNNSVKKILLKNNISLKSHKEAVLNAMSSQEVKEKLKKSYNNSINKRKETCLNRYGVEYSSQSNLIKEKIAKTSIEKYGVSHFLKNKTIQEKKKSTCLNKYGVDNISKTEECKNKRKLTNLNIFGCECSFQNDNVKDKIKTIMINKYGVDNISKHKETHDKVVEKNNNRNIKKILKHFSDLNLSLISDYKNGLSNIEVKCNKCSTVFETTHFNLMQHCMLCPQCFPIDHSFPEKEILEFIKSLNIDNIVENNRTVIPPYELDIYLPDKKVAIEFNGLYWHSLHPKEYHLNKTLMCEEKNIFLIHIFEDEWCLKKDIVKSRLKQILEKNDGIKVYARKCEIKEIDSKTKDEFLDKFHIQGKDISSINLGAFYNNKIVSVMTFSKGNISKGSKFIDGVWELNRFSSDYQYRVIGITSKLLSYFKQHYDWKKIFSYCDRRWSTGNTYYKIGFNLDYITSPNYWYVKGMQRIHRFNLRKKENDPKDIPEWVLRSKEGYNKIWDCGNLKFHIENINL